MNPDFERVRKLSENSLNESYYTYDYFKYPVDTIYLSEIMLDLLKIYNTVSIQVSDRFYVFKCEYLESGGNKNG